MSFGQNSERDAAILAWQKADVALAEAKAAEMAARLLVVKLCFPDGTEEGTHTCVLGNGYEIKATAKYNYSLSETDKPKGPHEPFATRKALNVIEKMGNEGAFIAERLVKWKPELSLSEYRGLSPDYKAEIDKALTISPGTPSLELKVPKKAI